MSTSPEPEPAPRQLRARGAASSSGGRHFLGGPGERRRSRERALELTYEAEQKGVDPSQILAELPVAPAAYAVQLVTGLSDQLEEVDALVDGHSSGWAIGRMPAVDRSILRLATYELLRETEVPVAVVIDEAVELAKEYSTEDSPRFVNGVLAAVAASVRPDDVDAKGAPAPASNGEGADGRSQDGGYEQR